MKNNTTEKFSLQKYLSDQQRELLKQLYSVIPGSIEYKDLRELMGVLNKKQHDLQLRKVK